MPQHPRPGEGQLEPDQEKRIAALRRGRREGIVDGLQAARLQIDVAEIVLHEADQPNVGLDLAQPAGRRARLR